PLRLCAFALKFASKVRLQPTLATTTQNPEEPNFCAFCASCGPTPPHPNQRKRTRKKKENDPIRPPAPVISVPPLRSLCNPPPSVPPPLRLPPLRPTSAS